MSRDAHPLLIAEVKPAYTCNGKPIDALDFYAIACDPKRSVAIEACAGAGKTWMLVSRILRALLEGTKPESILAITYTKKAAGEMRERLFEWLRGFSAEPDESKLAQELIYRGVPFEQALALVPRLKALRNELLAQARSVEIRTFHSWFAQLLSASPLGVLDDLGLPVQYDLIEDDSTLFNPAWHALLQRCTQDPTLKEDLDTLLRQQGTHNTQEALRTAWSRRLEFMLADSHGVLKNSVPYADDPSPIVESDEFTQRWLSYAQHLGQEKTQTPKKAASDIEYAITSIEPPIERLKALRNALFVKMEDRLSTNLSKFEVAQQAELELVALLTQWTQYQAYLYQQRMTRLMRALLECYAQLKRSEHLVDMADLERVALHLLGDTEAYGWVAQRLDARITQVLIDEFQDTNPLQWQALRGWLSAYGGAGGGGRMSVFIVGDPKQSIYRFRRADPSVFIAACDFLQHTLGGYKLACDHTRRNAPQVMRAVNAVFHQLQEQHRYDGFRLHTTAAELAGEVSCLPMIMRSSSPQERKDFAREKTQSKWRDSLTEPRYQEEERLRLQEVRQACALVRQWVEEQGWSYADIKVLARRKDRLRELAHEFNQHSVAWRFADDVQLVDTLEVQDLIALLDVLASPIQDLSLAQVLRSPIFGLHDEDLMILAEQVELKKQNILESDDEPISWWCVLMMAMDDEHVGVWPVQLCEAAKQLKDWKIAAQHLPPHDLLDKIYNDAHVLLHYAKAVPAAMRESVQANLRAFLQQSLHLNSGRYATPYNFVRALRSQGVKSEPSRQEDTVELLTIHGAKGLEARGIILLDTDPTPTRAERLSVLMEWPAQERAPTQFIFYTDQKSLPADGRVLAQKEEYAEQREEFNALYVAMTRAKERLVFSALEPFRKSSQSWWQQIHAATEDAGVKFLESMGIVNEQEYPKREGSSLLEQLFNTGPYATKEAMQPFHMTVLPTYMNQADMVEALPDAIYEMLQAEMDMAGVGRAAWTSTNAQKQVQRFGDAVHRFLELEKTTELCVNMVMQEVGLTQQQTMDAARRAQLMMSSIHTKRFFDAEFYDEVYKEVPLSYRGQIFIIDRLVRVGDEWWILDFKSAAHPLQFFEESYREQLRQYKEALKMMMPDVIVHTALITGEGGLIVL